MRLLAAADGSAKALTDEETQEWSRITAGDWLAKTLNELRHPEVLARLEPGAGLKAELRPYQEIGVRWLHLLSSLASAHASPTTWDWGKPSRYSR